MIHLFALPALFLFGVLAYVRYESALVLLTALLPTYLLRFAVLGIPTNFFESAVGILVISGLLQFSIRKQWISGLKNTPKSIIFWTSAFIISALISTHISLETLVSLGVLKGWILFPILFGYIVGAATWCSNEIKYNVIKSLLLSGGVVAILGLLQIGRVERIYSIYDTPNSLALFLAPLVVMAVWQAIQVAQDRLRNALLALVMGAALLATQSVSGIISVYVSLLLAALFWLKSDKREKVIMYVCIVSLVAAVYLGFSGKILYLTRPLFEPGSYSSLSVRLQLWSVAQLLVQEHPIFGVGLGQFEPFYQEKLHKRFAHSDGYYSQVIPEFVFRDPHNFLLSFWLNLGLLGLLSFLALHYLALRKGIAILNTPIVQGLTLALITLLLFGFTDTIYWKNDLSALHWLLIFLLF